VYIVLCHAQELLLSGSLGLRYKRNEGAKVAPQYCYETANERCTQKKDTGPREDILVRGRRLRRLLLNNL
jgi:hypothetical protein